MSEARARSLLRVLGCGVDCCCAAETALSPLTSLFFLNLNRPSVWLLPFLSVCKGRGSFIYMAGVHSGLKPLGFFFEELANLGGHIRLVFCNWR